MLSVNSNLQYGTSKHFESLREMSLFKFSCKKKFKKLGTLVLSETQIYNMVHQNILKVYVEMSNFTVFLKCQSKKYGTSKHFESLREMSNLQYGRYIKTF